MILVTNKNILLAFILLAKAMQNQIGQAFTLTGAVGY